MLIFANNLTLFLYAGKIEFLLTGVIQPNMTGLLVFTPCKLRLNLNHG